MFGFSIMFYIALAVVFLLFMTFKILREYERGVVFLLGRFYKVKGPGLIIIIPGIQKMVRVDLRLIVMDVPTQDVISKDNVSVKVNAVIYFRVVDPERAIIQVANYFEATSQLAQTRCARSLASTNWMRCCRRETSSTTIFRPYSTKTPIHGGSRSPMSKSSMWISMKA